MCDINYNDIYLVDSSGIPHFCNKTNDKYVCPDVLNAKVYINDNCVWKKCNINFGTNEIDYNSCETVNYNYYVVNTGNGCIMYDLKNNMITNTSSDSEPLQCCNMGMICGEVPSDNSGIIKTNAFNYWIDDVKNNTFTCNKKAGSCVPYPSDYTAEKYPDLTGIKYNCNKCTCCPKDNNTFVNPVCKPCSIDIATTPTTVTPVTLYDCINNTCVPSSTGQYINSDVCNSACANYKLYNIPKKSNLSSIMVIMFSFMLFLILISILVYVLYVVRHKKI